MVLMPRQTSGRSMPPTARHHCRASRRRRSLMALASAALVLPVISGAAPWEFEPRVALGQVWTDNVDLAPDGLEESEWITELRPGFTLRTDGPRARVNLDYDLQALWYADNSDLDDTYHRFNGNGNVMIAPGSLFLDAFARFDQQSVDIRDTISFDNLYETNNRTDAFVFGASPYHVGHWGSWGESEVRYQYQGVRYSNTDPGATPPEDSDTSAAYITLGSPTAARGFSWRARGSYARTEFEQASEFEYARVELDVGIPVSLRTRLTATVGQESDVEEDPSIGGLDSPFWFVGFEWAPSELQSLEARVGERFYGTAWEVHWQRRGSRGELNFNYDESPTTSSGVFGNEDVFMPGFEPGGVGSLDQRVFIWKRLSGAASYELARSTIMLRIYADRREFQDGSDDTEEMYGATLSYDWEVAARTTIGGTVDWSRHNLEPERTDDLGEFSVRLTRELTGTLSGVFRVSHFLRNSDVENDYSTNMVSLFLEARF